MGGIIINGCSGFEILEVSVFPCSGPLKDWEKLIRLYFRVKVSINKYGKWSWFLAIVPKDIAVFSLVVKKERYSRVGIECRGKKANNKYVRFYLNSLDGPMFSAMASADPNCEK